MGGLDASVTERGFAFAAYPIVVEKPLPPGALFDVGDRARLYTKVLGDLGMIGDLDRAAEEIKSSFQALHDALVADRQDGDDAVKPFFAIDLPDEKDAFPRALAAFNRRANAKKAPDVSVWEPLWYELTPWELNRRSFADETDIKGWNARAMVLGGDLSQEPGLRFTGQSAAEQIRSFKALRTSHEGSHHRSVMALMNVLDHLVINAASREENVRLLDHSTFSRIPQAGNPETGRATYASGSSRVLYMYTPGLGEVLAGSDDGPYLYGGIRVSVGPKAV